MIFSAPLGSAQPRLRRYILSWTLGALLLVWLTLIAFAWATGYREAREFSDGQLVAVSKLWFEAWPSDAAQNRVPELDQINHEYMQDVAVMAWQDGRLVADSHRMAAAIDVARLRPHGFSTQTLRTEHGQSDWRTFGTTLQVDGQQRRVLALLDMRKRYAFGLDIAKHMAEPALLVLPLVMLLLWWTVRRGLRPLDQLSNEVAALDGFAGQRLDTQHRFQEFTSTVSAINSLVETLQTRAQRERAFASDVAHELRTPLQALALQASALRHGANPDQLEQLEREALRAGRILAQLLDLARAQRTGPDGLGARPVQQALGDVAAEVLGRHAQLAHETDHELALNQPSEPVLVEAPPLLLELALRNLVENALRHTPAGTLVQVEVWRTPQARGISVSDNGQRLRPAAEAGRFTLPLSDTTGLGLGLRLVERIAEQIGAQLLRDAGDPPMTTRFTLQWAQSAA